MRRLYFLFHTPSFHFILSPFPYLFDYTKRKGQEDMVDMNNFNISATLNVFKLLTKPTLCLPHATVSTFNHLPIPLTGKAFGKYGDGDKKVDIRAVVLDKDDCFAVPKTNEVFKEYQVRERNFCLGRFLDFTIS